MTWTEQLAILAGAFVLTLLAIAGAVVVTAWLKRHL